MLSDELSGNGNSIVKVFCTGKSCANWGWKRLNNSGIEMDFLEIVKVNFLNKIPVLEFNEIHENDGEDNEVSTGSNERKEKCEIVIELSSDTEVDQKMKDKACKI